MQREKKKKEKKNRIEKHIDQIAAIAATLLAHARQYRKIKYFFFYYDIFFSLTTVSYKIIST